MISDASTDTRKTILTFHCELWEQKKAVDPELNSEVIAPFKVTEKHLKCMFESGLVWNREC